MSCETVEFFGHRKYEELIPEYGNIHMLHAGYGEATHKAVKAAYSHTNKQKKSALDQVQPFVLQVLSSFDRACSWCETWATWQHLSCQGMQ